ncbi:PTS sugar transporter subunit IIA [Oceanobacillus sp. CFH 90083]|uniref:PTS sugar transporter subunit IIA n=1 Tax=Oceanobacillus sp. CFH 90083 TaxID=2592336 RepID=UPI00128D14E5|nr:PTS sugar transporter subunit IIA [Oceanobacillus sp. CFH 90083]
MSELRFDEEVILLNLEAADYTEVLQQMGENLVKHHYVKESFIPAIIEREQEFATGLPTAGVSVAIPHTDAVHVNQKTISIATLKNPVDFVIMGEESETTPVQIVFMLAMDEPHSQLKLLQNLMKIFQEDTFLEQLLLSESVTEMLHQAADKLHLHNFKGGEKL